MTDETAVVEVIEAEYVPLGTIRTAGPVAMIQQATDIAAHLADIVESRSLYSIISGKKHVRVEGWTTLGAMLGVLPREVRVEYRPANPDEHQAEGYEAYIELVRVNDGAVIGGASAICTRAERNWSNRDEFAIRSMATTRATGKAYRLGFSWIMTLAGYEPTPYEEMSTDPEPRRKHRPQSQKASNGNRPLAPDVLKGKLQTTVANKPDVHQENSSTPGQRGLVLHKLEECFAPADDATDKRHAVTGWLFGKPSSKDWTMAEAGALLDWLLDKDADEGTYDLHPSAAAEAEAVYREAMKDAGQGEMELEAE